MLLILLAVLAEVGTGQPVRGQERPGGVSPAPDTLPLPDGLYASRQVMTSSTKPSPRLGRIRVRTSALVLHRVRREADSIFVSSRFCDVRQDRIGPAGTVLDSAFVAALPTWESVVSLEGSGPWLFRTSGFVAVVGADLDDPAEDPLPSDPEDPRVTDPDGDGEPGVTVRVEGVVDGGVFIVQRIERALEGTLNPDGRMTGTVIGANQQSKLGASNFILRAFTPSFVPDTQAEQNPFSWVPLPSGAGCPEIVALEARLFGALE